MAEPRLRHRRRRARVRRRVRVLPPREGRLRVGAVALWAAFAALTAVVASGALGGLDVALLSLVQLPHAGWLDLAANVATIAGQGEVTAGIALGIAVARLLRRRRGDFWVPLAIGVVVLVEVALKRAVPHAPPPEELHRGVALLPFVHVSFAGGFPSGHVARAAFLGAIVRGIHPAIVAAAVALMMLSRVYLADHWPTDTVGGALLGLAVAALALRVARR